MTKYGSCTYCGKIEELINGICNECYDEEINHLKVVKNYLLNNPHSNAMEISLSTDIPIDKITRLIKKGTIM
ncbi:hypothetical protein [Virgibacillus doumboii]|uniref:hypothetical protein n=1 Tax=Virgibacillus doumboii TaxID=2697503 RepID=UPI0013DF1796|nr:hypothetical protein [Virgibacillus doumboii]